MKRSHPCGAFRISFVPGFALNDGLIRRPRDATCAMYAVMIEGEERLMLQHVPQGVDGILRAGDFKQPSPWWIRPDRPVVLLCPTV